MFSDFVILNSLYLEFQKPLSLDQYIIEGAGPLQEDLIDYSEGEEDLPRDSDAPEITKDKWHPISTGSRESLAKIKFKKNIVPLKQLSDLPINNNSVESESKLNLL